jgi:hypothetical protein
MSEQMQLFPSVTGQISIGDCATCKVNVLWTVEKFECGMWRPSRQVHNSRHAARYYARQIRFTDNVETRVIPYKAAFDSKGRKNRQIDSQRLDW